jgi:hypothetical protein
MASGIRKQFDEKASTVRLSFILKPNFSMQGLDELAKEAIRDFPKLTLADIGIFELAGGKGYGIDFAAKRSEVPDSYEDFQLPPIF